MPSPEISRRCRGCGASVRASAHFCPQCGTTMVAASGRRGNKETPTSYDATIPPPGETAPDVNGDEASDARGWLKSDEPTMVVNPTGARGGNETARAEGAERLTAAAIPDPSKRRRPVTVVEENLRPGVEKLREASIVMLDEAPDDSGLRFVLIGVALFLIFLLFLYITVFTY